MQFGKSGNDGSSLQLHLLKKPDEVRSDKSRGGPLSISSPTSVVKFGMNEYKAFKNADFYDRYIMGQTL